MAGGTHPLDSDGVAAPENAAASRWQVIRRHIEDGESLTQIAEDAGIALRTVQRWHAAYRRDGIVGLTPAEPFKRGRRTHPDLQVFIEGLALSKPRRSIAAIARKAQTKAAQQGWPTVSYNTVPQIMADATGDYMTIYAAQMAVVTMGVGEFIEPFAQKIDQRPDGCGLPIGLAMVVLGLVVASIASYYENPILGLLAAVILGLGYGSVLVTGLSRVQQIAPPQDLAGLTGIFYALTYFGFLFPTFIAALLPIMPYNVTLLVFAGLALISMVIAFGRIRHVRGPWGKRGSS